MSTIAKNQEELSKDEQSQTNGGSLLGGMGNDLSNMVSGGISLSNSSSGSDGQGNSYSSNDSHNVGFGLGNMTNSEQY